MQREDVLGQALQLLEIQGIASTTLEMVADRIDYPLDELMRFWPDKKTLPGATSLYYWEGKLEQEYEVQMLLKTNLANQQALLDCLKSHHPYQTPELLVLPVVHGDNDYLSWLNASLR